MATSFATLTWDEAVREYLLHVKATRADKTLRFYDVQLRQLVRWANESRIGFGEFGKRHLDRYLVARKDDGKSLTTLKSDAVAAKAFFRWCARNDIIDRSPLAEYQVRNTPEPVRYMPSDDEIRRILQALADHWSVSRNPNMRFYPAPKRVFFRERNYALIIGLLDTAARIGEMLSLKVEDVRHKEREALIRETKGKVQRTLPVSAEWLTALDSWLQVRRRVMADVPKEEDEGWLFISEYGGRMDESQFLKALKRLLRWADLSDEITLHSLRRYSLNRLAKHNLLGAQQIAGHKETKTTLMYTKLDADFMRDVHSEVGVVRGIVTSKRQVKQRKRLI